MPALLLLLSAIVVQIPAQSATTPARAPAHASATDLRRWKREARAVTIVRDDWGIAHVHGKTDADAVFGMIYAQAEDDFNRIETNYVNSMGRLAEAEGEHAIWQDLRMKLFINPDSVKAKYAKSPAWLKALMNGWADGLNYYLYTHPQVKPRVITTFEPWMALTFSEGSIGGDIESIDLDQLRAFYGDTASRPAPLEGDSALREPTGSNGFAIAPKNTANGRALLLINPHTSFFFRSELQVRSDEGLDAYGAATWGQFFIYQGFNDRLGWMHTSTGADAIDEYGEKVVRRAGSVYYRYGPGPCGGPAGSRRCAPALRPIVTSRIGVPYRADSGIKFRTFTVYRTHHGPVVRSAGGKWISVSLMERPVEALSQSFLRTKARALAEYEKVMELHANSSNNTIYADADGHIAYFHPQFVPKRNDKFDWTKPVDGSTSLTDWGPPHGLEDSPHVIDPSVGWIQNTNNWPYSAAGPDSPKQKDFPKYMDQAGESPRGLHAIRVLENRKDFTLDRLRDAAFDPYLTAFAKLVPPLLAAYDSLPHGDSLRGGLADPIAALRKWDYRWSAGSIPTSLAVFWGDTLMALTRGEVDEAGLAIYDHMATGTTAQLKLTALEAAVGKLTRDFGTWKTPWGEINRFQRLTGDIVQPFSDGGPSIPVPFTSARWGSLASFGARAYPGTKRWYGTYGNSFVAIVEFGKDSVRARAVTAGGESGDPRSKHFNDEAERYAGGNLRDVYFYPGQLEGHTERTYHPGE
jgi:acyl-homoserine-lactone acylase